MPPHVTILYRGPLSSCNYDCSYCPFAKRHETAAELRVDREALERFVDWVSAFDCGDLSIFFTPWGEALTRRWYQTALQQLSRLSFVRKVAVQTNLSWPTDWLDDCDTTRLGLWCTWHPSQVARDTFLDQCAQLEARGISHSVGMVAIPDDYDEIVAMRRALPDSTYLWLNAFGIGDGTKYSYSDEQLTQFTQIDPHFQTNTVYHPSLGRRCNTGSTVFSVNGQGDVRRCHFVNEHLGNIYEHAWQFPAEERRCPNNTCGCHIGYVHMPHLKQQGVYGDNILERVPKELCRC